MEKLILTGATGFIGRQTIPFLKRRNFDIHALTSKRKTEELQEDISWHSVNMFDYDKITAFCQNIRATHLLHLAWFDNPKERMTSSMNINWVEASLHLIREFVENGGKRITLAGSCAEYDWRYGYCSENITPEEPRSLYGQCKSSLNKIIQKYSLARGIHYSCGRIFFVYGPYESENRLVAYVITSLLMDRKAEVTHGNQIRDYLYATDVADALVQLLTSDVEGPVNIASGQPRMLREIIDVIGRKLNKQELIIYGSRDSSSDITPVLFADVARLQDEVKWIPKHDLENGIDATIDWWKSRLKVKLK